MKCLISLILIAWCFASNALSEEVRPGVFRTPDERFENLKDCPFTPHYLEVNSQLGKLRMHYVDVGPSDSDPVTAGNEKVFKKRIPGAKGQPHTIIKGGGHFLQENASEKLARIINELIAATALIASAAEKPNIEKLHVVLLADEKDHGPAGNGLHDYPLWQKRWALLLGGEEASDEKQVNLVGPPDKDTDYGEGIPNVEVATAWHWPSEEHFQTADVIVAYCYLEWTDERLAQVRRYLEGGGGLVLIHSATWTRPKTMRDGVAEVIGVGGFELFRHGKVQVDMAAPEHPICAELPETIILEDDETYWPPTPIMESVKVLATSVEDKAKKRSTPTAAQPMFWCYERGKGRVFGCVPGHSARTFDDPLFRKLLLRGIAWAAGECPLLFDEVLNKTKI
jgi:type 1 glutamine amidotransferase